MKEKREQEEEEDNKMKIANVYEQKHLFNILLYK